MALPTVAPATGALQSSAVERAKPQFSESFKQVAASAKPEGGPQLVSGPSEAQRSVSSASSSCREAKSTSAVTSASACQPSKAAALVDRVAGAQQRLDTVLKLAQSGKTFTPGELLAFQAQVYRASQELDLAGKVVEKGTAGIKQVLQTQV